ncbi:MAG: hypothetical protein JWO44_2810 [Bacteroidetes bacterium]|nr:hypothetical protein [Bacteroidota bacterium]
MKKIVFSPFILFLIACGSGRQEKENVSNTITNMDLKKDYEIKSIEAVNSVSISWSKPVKGLQLGVDAENNNVSIYLKNETPEPILVFSHVKADKIHLDPFIFFLKPKNTNEPYKEIQLHGARLKSSPIYLLLKKEVLIHKVDLLFWSRTEINGNYEIKPGFYELKLKYEPKNNSQDSWIGNLEAGPIDIIIK